MKIFFKILFILVILVSMSLGFLLSCLFYSNLTFFVHLREIYVATAMTTLNHRYLATTFISEDEIARIMEKNLTIPLENTQPQAIAPAPEVDTRVDRVDISENHFKGMMLIVHDPARVHLAVSSKLMNCGEKLHTLIASANAFGGINASGFMDPNGHGRGGLPIGIVIKDRKVVYNSHPKFYDIVGFNDNNILILGRYKRQDIIGLHLRDAVSFSPFIIINGAPQIKPDSPGYGLQPRTSIGQTRDGKVLLLVIDGRQLGSIGANLKTVQDIMLRYGAYNAANLDGGASTVMYYLDKRLNNPCSPYGERLLPTAWVIN